MKNVDKDIVVQMNADMRAGHYSDDLWKTHAGKAVDELWDDYVKSGGQ